MSALGTFRLRVPVNMGRGRERLAPAASNTFNVY